MLPTMQEIVDRAKESVPRDPLGFETLEYLAYLDYEHLKRFKWDAEIDPREVKPNELTREGVLARMENYMSFAYGKARGQRGISANRSVQHYIAWTWLAGDKELADRVLEEYTENYCGYGIPILNMIREHYGWPEVPE